jgi:hemoglobin-like flavoprotein
VRDARLLKKSLALIEPQSERVMAYFFGTLFVRNPELRAMFPLTLEETRTVCHERRWELTCRKKLPEAMLYER